MRVEPEGWSEELRNFDGDCHRAEPEYYRITECGHHEVHVTHHLERAKELHGGERCRIDSSDLDVLGSKLRGFSRVGFDVSCFGAEEYEADELNSVDDGENPIYPFPSAALGHKSHDEWSEGRSECDQETVFFFKSKGLELVLSRA